MGNALERWFDSKRLSPMRDMADIQESFDRLFNEFSSWRRSNGMQELGFSPACEITEDGTNYIMKFDVPGVTKDQVTVEADNDRLTVRAERKEEKKSESKKKYVSEIHYGSYVRTFTLPGPVDEKKVDAKFDNGVLTVTVPKTESVMKKHIPIQ